jgi:hypothetical protein
MPGASSLSSLSWLFSLMLSWSSNNLHLATIYSQFPSCQTNSLKMVYMHAVDEPDIQIFNKQLLC